MKKYYTFLFLSALFNFAEAKNLEEDKAFALLDQVGEYKNFRATFMYTQQQPGESPQHQVLEGIIVVQGAQYRLAIEGQEVVTNGETVWTYLVDAHEVQIADYDPEQALSSPWGIFATYREAYLFHAMRSQQIGGAVYDVIDLLAKDKESLLPKVTVTLARATKHIKRVAALDNDGVVHTFNSTNFETDLALEASFFTFNTDESEGVEVIDMRE